MSCLSLRRWPEPDFTDWNVGTPLETWTVPRLKTLLWTLMKTWCQFLPQHEAEAEEGGAEVVGEGAEVSLPHSKVCKITE